MDEREKIVHIHSGVEGRLPQENQIEYGEIAINYNSNSPFIAIKTAGETIADNEVITAVFAGEYVEGVCQCTI